MTIDNIWSAVAIFLVLLGLAYAAARFTVEATQASEPGRRWFMSSMLLVTVAVSLTLIVMISL